MPWRSPRLPVHTSLPLPSKVQQIDGVQVLRAVAVILVAWTHSGQNVGSPRGLLDFGIFGVDIFFVISGFILSSVVLRERGGPGVRTMGAFLKRRLLRIFPVYWFFALLTLVRFAWAHQPLARGHLYSFFLLPSFTHLRTPLIVAFSWTLVFEMFFYYTLALVLLKTVRLAVPVMIALLTAAVITGNLFGIRHPVWIVLCNPILLEFVLGAIVALVYARFKKLRVLGWGMTLLGTALVIYLAAYTPAAAANSQQAVMEGVGVLGRVMTWGVAAVLIVGGGVFWSPSLNSRIGRIFVALGTASYSAYLASPIVIELVSRLLYKLHGAPASTLSFALYKCLMVAAVLGLGWLCYDLIEWPLIRRLQTKFLHKAA
jgi:exopolysaccharide production protein ExoZ